MTEVADSPQAAQGNEKKVCLVSTEGDSFEVTLGVARMSELVKTMIDGTKIEKKRLEVPFVMN